MPTPSNRFIDKTNAIAIVQGLANKFEAKNANIVKDAAYVHTDNNYTDAAAAKLEGIETGAEENVIEGVQVNSTDLTADASKKVNVTVVEGETNGTIKVNGSAVAVHGLGSAAYADTSAFGEDNVIESIKVGADAQTITNKTVTLGTAAGATVATVLANDGTLPTGAAIQTYVSGLGFQTSQDVATAIAGASHITMSVVSSLPVSGETNVIYLVPDDNGGSNKDMYVWDATSSEFILVGNTEANLSGYVESSVLGGLTSEEITEVLATI